MGATQRCRRYTTRTQCLNAMDPYCGWQSGSDVEVCAPPPNKNPLATSWQQSITSCPILDAPGTHFSPRLFHPVAFFSVRHGALSSVNQTRGK